MTSSQISLFVVNNCISVQAAAAYSGYSLQYLRRLLRNRQLAGLKVGQVWLINAAAFGTYLNQVQQSPDEPFGPK